MPSIPILRTRCVNGHFEDVKPLVVHEDGSAVFGSKADFCVRCEEPVEAAVHDEADDED